MRGVLEEELTVEDALDPVPLAACHQSERSGNTSSTSQLSSYHIAQVFFRFTFSAIRLSLLAEGAMVESWG